MMTKPPAADEWDQLINKMGRLALAAGSLEMAIIAMVCRILGKSEEELRIGTNRGWCRKLVEITPSTWTDAEKKDLSNRITHIRDLYRRRNKLIHTSLAAVGNDSIPGFPRGSIVDLRTYGVGFTEQHGNTWTIGVVGDRIDLSDLDTLIDGIHDARIGLIPYMKLVKKIRHPAKPLPKPKLGKLL